MMHQLKYGCFAIFAGTLLALMIEYNSQLAVRLGSIISAWIAHGVGTIVSLILVLLLSRIFNIHSQNHSHPTKTPLWIYLGGIPGAFTVVLASIALSGSLSLAGTISLMLLGQILFGIALDHYGLLMVHQKKITRKDFYSVILLIIGSAMIIYGRGQ